MSKTVYLPHGGGPLPLLDEKTYQGMNAFIREIGVGYQPDAIVVFSAHWERDDIEVIIHHDAQLVYDYYGFPKESYQYEYNPPVNATLGKRILQVLNDNGISAKSSTRGFDHGVYVPLMLMYPNADIPVIQISLKSGLDETFHIHLGEVLSCFTSDDILFLGSGFSFHNLQEFMNAEKTDARNESFQEWLIQVVSGDLSENERKQKLIEWKKAPNSLYAHPRSEHLIPLHICYGLNQRKGVVAFNETIMDKRSIGVVWE